MGAHEFFNTIGRKLSFIKRWVPHLVGAATVASNRYVLRPKRLVFGRRDLLVVT
jgi:hypothetical protein